MKLVSRSKGRQGGVMDIAIHVSQKENSVPLRVFSSDKLSKIIKKGIAGTDIALLGVEEVPMLGIDALEVGRGIGTWAIGKNNMELFA